jgi:hypothetical protein
VAGRSTVSDAAPPEAFEFFIGGYTGTSHQVAWDGVDLRYERLGYGFTPEEIGFDEALPRPLPDWAAFRAAVDRLGVWAWAASYEPADLILDGTQWSLVLRWGERAVATGGSNAFPGVGATASGSNTFRAFLRAVRKLTGVDGIG